MNNKPQEDGIVEKSQKNFSLKIGVSNSLLFPISLLTENLWNSRPVLNRGQMQMENAYYYV